MTLTPEQLEESKAWMGGVLPPINLRQERVASLTKAIEKYKYTISQIYEVIEKDREIKLLNMSAKSALSDHINYLNKVIDELSDKLLIISR